jgi:two-component system, response regulator PdtaR
MAKPIVLIVEEEALIRMSAVHMIEDAGYAAVEARNAHEAIEILERRSDIRVVFTDVNMSGSMDGLKLAHWIRDRWPIHLIVASGLDLQDKLPANGRFVRKPYAAEHITIALDELFGSDPAPLLSDGGNKPAKIT